MKSSNETYIGYEPDEICQPIERPKNLNNVKRKRQKMINKNCILNEFRCYRTVPSTLHTNMDAGQHMICHAIAIHQSSFGLDYPVAANELRILKWANTAWDARANAECQTTFLFIDDKPQSHNKLHKIYFSCLRYSQHRGATVAVDAVPD